MNSSAVMETAEAFHPIKEHPRHSLTAVVGRHVGRGRYPRGDDALVHIGECSRQVAALKASSARRRISTFSCDMAYSDSPAASRGALLGAVVDEGDALPLVSELGEVCARRRSCTAPW